MDTIDKLFMSFKAYESTTTTFHDLCILQTQFVQYIAECEGVFSFEFNSYFHSNDLKQLIKSSLRENTKSPVFFSPKKADFLLDLFVRERIHFVLKYYKDYNKKSRGQARKKPKRTKVMNGLVHQ